ncbi:hypothetical protein EXIGLDRAFT_839464 [Exidia glandulosa HHB12029]|uniref:Uncharacterized protein n=1 Tax=Exidia glandulosa HHB12029 TaxID=1314781 RepID=A0A165F0V2_EXIGL|nr:hypothetical protein EXIGLDRAFT_839464 [Exidia glandulosa HHB12029]
MLNALANFVLNVALFFSKTTRDEKTVDPLLTLKMKVATHPIELLVSTSTYKESIPKALDALYKAISVHDVNHYPDVLQCRVTSVLHYRHRTKAHERIIVRYTFSEGGKIDVRFASLDRYVDLRAARRKPSTPELTDSSSPQPRYDELRIADTIASLGEGNYKLVRELKVPAASALHILDAIIIAKVVGDYAHQYSGLSHMCMWYATVLFLLLREHAGASATLREEPFLKRAGHWGRIPLVDPATGRLTLSSNQNEAAFRNAMEKEYSKGGKTQVEMAKHQTEMQESFELTKKDSLAILRPLVTAGLQEEHARFRTKTEECRAFLRAAAESKQKDAELAKKDAELAELRAELAALRASAPATA